MVLAVLAAMARTVAFLVLRKPTTATVAVLTTPNPAAPAAIHAASMAGVTRAR
jgi:hypothetical protein